jgi:hypothetical protein
MKNLEENKEVEKVDGPGCLPLIQIAVALIAIGYSLYLLITI